LLLACFMVSGAGCTKQVKKTWNLSRANRDFQAGQYDHAEISYLKVLRDDRANPDAIRQLGIIYQEQGKLVQALGYLRQAAQTETNNALVHLKLGQVFRGLGAIKDARERAQLALDRQPGLEDALLLLADTVDSTNALRDIRQQISQRQQRDADRAAYHVALGRLSLRERQVEKAGEEFRKALQLDPKSAGALSGIGAVFLAQTNVVEADKAFKQAADLSPWRSTRRTAYAEFKLRSGAVDEAKKQLLEISGKAPDFLPVWSMLAQVARLEKREDDYDAALKKLLSRDPINLDALEQRGRLLLAKRDATNAIATYERLASVYERIPQGHIGLARAYLLANDKAKAVASYENAIQRDTNHVEAIVELARLNLAEGKPAVATKSLEAYVQRRGKSPEAVDARLTLAGLYANSGDYARALQSYASITNDFPAQAGNPRILLLMGNLAERRKNPAQARAFYEQALALSPNFWPALGAIIDSHLAQTNFPAALDRVAAEVKRHPDVADPVLLLARLRFTHAQHLLGAAQSKRGAGQPPLKLADVPAAAAALQQAESAVQDAAKLAGDRESVYGLMAQIYVAAGKHQQALDTLNNVVAKTNAPAALAQIAAIQSNLKNYPAARDAYEAILKIRPNDAAVLNNLAYLYSENLVQLDRARQLAEQARQVMPGSYSTLDTLGWILFKQGDPARALPLLREASEKSDQREPEIEFHFGMASYMTGDEASALRALQTAARATRDFPGKPEAGKRLQFLALDPLKADPAALATLEKRVGEEPGDPVALNRLARVYHRDGAREKAMKTYEQAIKANPKDAQALIGLAQLYSVSGGDKARALQLAKNARELAPNDDEIARALGLLVYQSGDWKYAASLLKDAVRTKPNDSELWHALAWSLYALGQVTEAEAAMQKVGQPAVPPARAKDAEQFLALLAASKNPTQVVAMLPRVNDILKSNQDYLPALIVSAVAAEQQGRYEDARKAYEKALSQYPDFSPATRGLAVLFAQHLGDYAKAYELGTKARTAFPNDQPLSKALAKACYHRGDWAPVIQFLRSSQQQKDDAEALYFLGMAHHKLNQKREARVALEAALKLGLDPKTRQEAERAVGELSASRSGT
jgi:tetratricopeptide (TPR) repeat protein